MIRVMMITIYSRTVMMYSSSLQHCTFFCCPIHPLRLPPSVDSNHPTSSRWTRDMIHGMAEDSVMLALGNACISLVKYYEFIFSVNSVLYPGIISKSVFVYADSSIAACLHLLEDPTSGLGSTCLSHIVSSHGESFWQLWQSALQFLLSVTGTQCKLRN